jgi:hypothetical protein
MRTAGIWKEIKLMSAKLVPLLVLLFADAPPKPSNTPDLKTVIQAARHIVAAVVEAGQANQARSQPRKGDELTEYYVRAGAAAARKLPEDRRAAALLLGLGVALDRSSLMRDNLVTRFTWRQVETDAERKKRLAVLGEPTMHGRHDLTQHFVVSAALTALSGARAAEMAGVLKEWLDSEEGGSGFSFADLASDLAGITFATRLLARPARLADIEKAFRVADYTLSPKGLQEGLSRKEFEKQYGSLSDDRFRKALQALRKRVLARPGFKEGD